MLNCQSHTRRGRSHELTGPDWMVFISCHLPFFQECPSGVVNEETFKEIYSQFFPQGGEYLADIISITVHLLVPKSDKRACCSN